MFLAMVADDLVPNYFTTINCKLADDLTILIPDIYSSRTYDDIDHLKE
jgi:hypothetical protein